jgi:Tfp pilus assembly protein PilX
MEAYRMGKINILRQRGVALPVMLIILVVMLISSVYLLKSSNSSTMTASNMAYDAALSKAADLGLQMGFKYLVAQAAKDKSLLNASDTANGYISTYNPGQSVDASGFWTNSKTVDSTANGSSTADTVEYVIHRACTATGRYDVANACVQTSANPTPGGSPPAPGDSLDAGSPVYNSAPQIHYIITARIFGPRGGNVVSQMVVLIDA